MSDLPSGWTTASIGEICERLVDGSHNPPAVSVGGLPMLSAKNIDDDAISLENVRSIDAASFATEDARSRVRAGKVLLTIVGTIGRTAVVNENHPPFCLQRSVAVLSPRSHLPRFLMRALQSPAVQQTLNENAKGTAQKGIYLGALGMVELPVPPFNEQRRIVEKIDAIFDKSRAMRARLERLPALLERLKRSILAAAFRGDLTKDWRAAHPDVEPASMLLDRVRAERRLRWENEQRAKGKDPKRAAYDEPTSVDVASLPELPEGWAWASIGEIGFVTGGKRLPAGHGYAETPTDHPYVRVLDMFEGGVDTGNLVYLRPDTQAEISAYTISSEDTFISIAGTIGVAGRIPRSISGANLTENAARIRLGSLIHPDLLWRFLGTELGKTQVRFQTVATGQPKLALFRIEQIVMPVPPLDEQTLLLERVLEKFSFVDKLASSTSRLAARCLTLEQAALAKAFRGELVPQDPTDESASVLLDRIRAAHADEPQRPPRGRPAPKVVAAKPTATTATNGQGAAVEGAPVDLVVAAFQLAPRLTATSIGTSTGLDAASVKKALKALVDVGQVRVEGKARGTAYVWSAT